MRQLGLLELHRDGYDHPAKARERKRDVQTIYNQNRVILALLGVSTMDDAVEHAIWFGIIEHRPPQPPDISPLWSEALQNYHEKYLLSLPETERRKVGCEW